MVFMSVHFFFLFHGGPLFSPRSLKPPVTYVTPSRLDLSSSSLCLACLLMILQFLYCLFTLASACFTLLESLLLNSFLVWSPTFSPALNMTWFFTEAPLLKCKLAEHVAIRTLFLPCYLLLGHLFQTKAFMDSFKFFVLPGKHLARRAGSFSLS